MCAAAPFTLLPDPKYKAFFLLWGYATFYALVSAYWVGSILWIISFIVEESATTLLIVYLLLNLAVGIWTLVFQMYMLPHLETWYNQSIKL